MATDHHYVPKCYLKGFTDPSPNLRYAEDDEPRIWQAELKTRRIRLRPTRKVGCSPGFYSLGYEDTVKDEAAERAHGELETVVAPVLRQINSGEFLPGKEDWENLLYFAAVLATRGPRTMDQITNLRRRGAELIMNFLAHMPLDSFTHRLKRTYPDREFTQEQALEIQRQGRGKGNFIITPSNAKVVQSSLKVARGTIFPLFMQMHWTYLLAPHSYPFICSDYPVSWVDPTIPRSSRRGHGLEARNVEVSFPLGSYIAILGHWEPGPLQQNLNVELVDQINLRSIERARVEILGPTRESVEWGLRLRVQ